MGKNNKAQYAYSYLINKGLSPIAAAGIVGNLQAESGFDTTVIGKADTKGSIGIAQWHSSRKQGLIDFAKDTNRSYDSLDTQLDYLLEELNSPAYAKALQGVNSAKNPGEAAVAFMNHFERPAEWAKRQSVGKRVGVAASVYSGEPIDISSYQGGDNSYAESWKHYEMPANMQGTSKLDEEGKDVEVEQAKAELLQKQNEANYLAEINAQYQAAQQQQQLAEQQYLQQQQAAQQQDDSYLYQAPQIQLPEYEAPQLPTAQEGGKLTFLQPTSKKLPTAWNEKENAPSSEVAMSIGGEDGEPAYLIPSFKYGKPLADPIGEFKKTGEHLGGPFKTWQEADKWENEVRHPAVEQGRPLVFNEYGEYQEGGLLYAQNGAKIPPPHKGSDLGRAVRGAGNFVGGLLESATEGAIDLAKNTTYGHFVEPALQGTREWLFENVRPVAYPGVINSVREVGTGLLGLNSKPVVDNKGDYSVGEEAWRMSLGLKTAPKYFQKSQYKPAKSKNSNIDYYSLSKDVIDPKKFVRDADLTSMKVGDKKVVGSLAPYIRDNFMPEKEFSEIDPLQNFTVSMGEDEKGKYLSIYDIYDFDNTPLNSFAKPFEVYDRIYLDKKKGNSTRSNKRNDRFK